MQPVRLDDEAPIEPLLKQVSAAIRDGGIPWVDKALSKAGGAERFSRMAEEGWQE